MEFLTLPLDIVDESIGVIFFSSNKTNVYKPEHVKFLSTIENSIAISMRQNIYKNDLLLSSIIALAKMVEARDDILLKPGKLTIEEFNEMKNHTVYGVEIIEVLDNKGKIFDPIITDVFTENKGKFQEMHDKFKSIHVK